MNSTKWQMSQKITTNKMMQTQSRQSRNINNYNSNVPMEVDHGQMVIDERTEHVNFQIAASEDHYP